MRMLENGTWKFESTGRTVTCYRNIIGIDTEGIPFDGYDSTLDVYDNGEFIDASEMALSCAERVELADEMIARWTRFKQKALGADPHVPSRPDSNAT